MIPARALLARSAVVALAAHAAALGWLATLPPPPPPRVRLPPAKVTLVARRPPPPPPEAKPPEPRPAEAEPRKPRAPEPPRVAVAEPPTPTPAPPLPAPRRFAVSIDATVPGGGVAVPTTEGPTAARGRADLPASAPAGDNAGPTAPVDAVEVERAPRLVRQPSATDLRALYPDAARRDQLEADVPLRLLVDASGKVTEVRVLEPAGGGFDEAAMAAARGFVFRPAERGGRPVPVWITWTMKFRLDA
jgi:protein TonB